MSSYDLAAFESPNFEPLVEVGIDIDVNWDHVIRQTSLRKFRAHKKMCPHVATLRLFPGIAGATIKAFCSPPIRGVVLETFGAGNAPQRPDLIEALKEACDRGVVVVAISQCVKGSVSDAYETARTLRQVGVVPGSDMTPECALTKLSYLLSKTDLTLDQIRDLIGIPLRGELTSHSVSAPSQDTKDVSTDILDTNKETINNVLSQFVRLSRPLSSVPEVKISTDALATATEAQHTAAPWTWTMAEAYTTEYVLLPFLIHLAAAKNDLESLQYCIDIERQAAANPTESPRIGITRAGNIAGGIINCLDTGSGRSPLHVSALNGHVQAVTLLLRSGALVHMRDTLGHTAIYYAARHGHLEVVDVLVQAGAVLGGFDTDFAKLGLEHARRMGDKTMMKIWVRAGVRMPIDETEK